MNKRIIFFIIFLVFGILAAVILYGIISRSGSSGSGSFEPLPEYASGTSPFSPPSSPPKTDRIAIGTSAGIVEVKNFYANARAVNAEGMVLITRTQNFDIVYFPQDSSFLISITESPVLDSARGGENELLNILGISTADACKLKVRTTVPAFVDVSFVGKDLGLSFCSNTLE